MLTPQVNSLREKHKRNPQRLNEELAKLTGKPARPCSQAVLPVLLQAPFLSVMYRLFESSTISGKPNDLLSHSLFGATLNQHWLPVMQGTAPFAPTGLVFLGLFALLAAVATYSVHWQNTRMATARTPPCPAVVCCASSPTARSSSPRSSRWPPGIYLLTTNAWTAAERAWLRRPRANHIFSPPSAFAD